MILPSHPVPNAPRGSWSRQTLFAVLTTLLGCWGTSPVGAQTQPFIDQAILDFQGMSDYVNGTFSKSLGFYSTLGWDNPPEVFDILGGPRVEVGVGAGADIIDLPDLNSIPLGALLLQSNLSIPSVIPIPFPVATARVGLMNGLDIGLRLTYLPNVSIPEIGFTADFTGWGLDFRYKILDGVTLPTVTVGVSWDTIQGQFSVSTNVDQTSTYQSQAVAMSGNSVYSLHWDVKSFGSKLMVGKSLGMIYPFGAVGFQRNSGIVSSSINSNGNVTVGGSSAPFDITVNSEAAPAIFEPKYILGFDIGQGLHWAVVGESNGTDIAGSTSFRIQF